MRRKIKRNSYHFFRYGILLGSEAVAGLNFCDKSNKKNEKKSKKNSGVIDTYYCTGLSCEKGSQKHIVSIKRKCTIEKKKMSQFLKKVKQCFHCQFFKLDYKKKKKNQKIREYSISLVWGLLEFYLKCTVSFDDHCIWGMKKKIPSLTNLLFFSFC